MADSYSDIAMVIITLAYVVATVYLVKESNKTNSLTRAQIEQNKTILEEQIRPIVTVNFTISEHFVVLRIANEGRRTAENVSINWEGELAKGISFPVDEIKGVCFNIVPGSYWDLPVKPLTLGSNFEGDDCVIKIHYECSGKTYEDFSTINLSSYDWIWIGADLTTEVKKIRELMERNRSVLRLLTGVLSIKSGRRCAPSWGLR